MGAELHPHGLQGAGGLYRRVHRAGVREMDGVVVSMTVLKSMIGSYVGALIAIWFCRWLGWLPSYDFAAERYFAEHHREIAIGLLAVGWALGVVCALLVAVYAMYRMARSID